MPAAPGKKQPAHCLQPEKRPNRTQDSIAAHARRIGIGAFVSHGAKTADFARKDHFFAQKMPKTCPFPYSPFVVHCFQLDMFS
jgi:hypothetical protein